MVVWANESAKKPKETNKHTQKKNGCCVVASKHGSGVSTLTGCTKTKPEAEVGAE